MYFSDVTKSDVDARRLPAGVVVAQRLEYLNCHLQRHLCPLNRTRWRTQVDGRPWGRQPIHSDDFLKRGLSKSKLVFVTTPESKPDEDARSRLEESCHDRQLKYLHCHLQRHRRSHILQPTQIAHSSCWLSLDSTAHSR